jgi:arabinofuranosyltransferase
MMHDDIATPAAERSPRTWMRAAWLALAALAALLCWSYADVELIDDAFISLRYADNLLAGHGLVFNPGERVEGYSNFLWVVLLAATGALGLEMPVASQWLGALFGLGLVWATATALPGHRPWRLLAPALLVGNLTVWLWAVHGLETVMFACWVTLGIRSDLRAWRRGTVPLGSALWYALAALTRPEGPYFFVASTAYWAVVHPRALFGRAGARHLAVFGIVVGAHLLWRHGYYGDWVPNTAHAKLGLSTELLARGLRYLWAFARPPGALFLLLCFPAALAARRDTSLRFLVLLVLGYLAVITVEGGDAFPAHRFVVPICPALYLLAAEGARQLDERWRRRGRVVTFALVAFAALALGLHAESTRLDAAGEAVTSTGFIRDMRQAAGALSRAYPAGTTIALNPAGAVPYYTGFVTYDMLGLTDSHIARRQRDDLGEGTAGHEKGDGAYILGRRPDLILLGNVYLVDSFPAPGEEVQIPLFLRSEYEIGTSPELRRDYQLELLPTADGRYLAAYRRRDLDPESGVETPAAP